MTSESARASSATEAHFRISAPNSLPRSLKILALDARSTALVRRLAQDRWCGASFLVASPSPIAIPNTEARVSVNTWLSDLAGQPKDMNAEISSADLVVMIATAGEKVQSASIIGEACCIMRVPTTAFVLGDPSLSDAGLTLAQLRPWALMLVIASAEDCLADMLSALRA